MSESELLQRYGKLIDRLLTINEDLKNTLLTQTNLLDESREETSVLASTVDGLTAMVLHLQKVLADNGIVVTNDELSSVFDATMEGGAEAPKISEFPSHSPTFNLDDDDELPVDLKGFANYDRKWIWRN